MVTGIILAAGKSSRLGDLTKDTPKCLLDISGKCSLDRMIENLVYSGVKKIVIVTGFQHDKIVEFVQIADFNMDYDKIFTIKFIRNENWETTNNAYSLNLALEYTKDEDIIVLNGDVVCYKDLIKEVVESPLPNTLAYVRKKELNEEDMKISICDEFGFIKAIDKKLDIDKSKGEFTGIFKFHDVKTLKLELERALKWDINCWFERALNEYCYLHAVTALDVSHNWFVEIDFPEDLELARDRFKYNDPPWEWNRRHESIQKGERNLDDALALMVDFRNVLNKYNIPYHLAWGLALGSVREGKPLKFDTDLDFVYPKEYEELVWEKVVPEMRKLRCFIANREDFCDSDVFINRDGESVEFNCYEKTVINGKEKCIYSPQRCKLYWDAYHSNKVDKIMVMGEEFNIPFDVENYLTGFYGNWRIPANTKPRSF